jgi:hypothetical protein
MYISYSLSFGEVLHHCLGVWDRLQLNQSLVCTVTVKKGAPTYNHDLPLASSSLLRSCFNGFLLTPPSILFHIDVITLSRMLRVFHLRCKSGLSHIPDKGKLVCAHCTCPHIRRRCNHQWCMESRSMAKTKIHMMIGWKSQCTTCRKLWLGYWALGQ